MFKNKSNPFISLIPIAFFIVLLFYFLNNTYVVFNFFSEIIHIFNSLIIGAFIAYFLNPILKALDKNFSIPKWASIIIIYTLFILSIVLFIVILLPNMFTNSSELIKSLPNTVSIIQKYINDLPSRFSVIKQYGLDVAFNDMILKFADNLQKYFSPDFFSSFFLGLINVGKYFINIFMGIILSIYMLVDKDKLLGLFDKMLYTIFNKHIYKEIRNILYVANQTFSNFITGKTMCSLIIGVICFIVLYFSNVKYALLFSIFIGITNMIPYFGPILGGVVISLITLFYSPIQAVWVGTFILGLQQFDSLFLAPKIIGDKVGSSPLLIITSILAGGYLWGVLGMFLGIPIFATLKYIFESIFKKKYRTKLLLNKSDNVIKHESKIDFNINYSDEDISDTIEHTKNESNKDDAK